MASSPKRGNNHLVPTIATRVAVINITNLWIRPKRAIYGPSIIPIYTAKIASLTVSIEVVIVGLTCIAGYSPRPIEFHFPSLVVVVYSVVVTKRTGRSTVVNID